MSASLGVGRQEDLDLGVRKDHDAVYELCSKEHAGLMASLERAGIFTTASGRPQKGSRLAKSFLDAVDAMKDARLSADELLQSNDVALAKLAPIVARYQDEAAGSDEFSYADCQTRLLDLLETDEEVLAQLRRRIRYIIVDEYQDTNPIQEEIVLKLGGEDANICVVGDDDQSLYRFRGATVENIIRFDENFAPDRCAKKELTVNYRSQPGIVDFCCRWMESLPCSTGISWEGEGGARYRVPKRLSAFERPDDQGTWLNPISVASCTGDGLDDWCERMLELVRSLPVDDLSQITFLCHSTRWSDEVNALISHFEKNGIRTYSPRSGGFFELEEVRLAIGTLMLATEEEGRSRRSGAFDDCVASARDLVATDRGLAAWIEQSRLMALQRQTDKSEHPVLELFFQMLAFEPFASWIGQSRSMTLADTLPARNLAKLAELIETSEAEQNAKSRYGWNRPSWQAHCLFDEYLPFLKDAGLIEGYEDEEEAVPSGHISFMTFHQAKGMEFPVTIVCSLDQIARSRDDVASKLHRLGGHRRAGAEPAEHTATFDYWRVYYTAFSRAADLLVLTTSGKKPMSSCFGGLYEELPSTESLDLSSLHLRPLKPSRDMRSYAFTSDVAAYRRCPRKYRLNHLLGFSETTRQSLLFGTLVHHTVEDIHRRVLRTGERFVPKDDVYSLVCANAAELESATGSRLKARVDEAYRQTMRYIVGYRDIWQNVRFTELSLSDVRQLPGSERGGYILKGQIDLVSGDDGRTTIVDFKTGRIPRDDSPTMSHYREQLLVYKSLLDRRTDVDLPPASEAKLFFTGASREEDPLRSFEVDAQDVRAMLEEFDGVVRRIEERNLDARAEDSGECKRCNFRWHCGRA